MKKDGLDGIGKVKIYKGTVYRVFADNFSLNKGRPVGTKNVDKGKIAYFYRTVDGNEVCIDTGIDSSKVFSSRNSAFNNCDAAILNNAENIKKALSNNIINPKERSRILLEVTKATESFYYSSSDLKFEQEMPKKKLKQMLEERNRKNNDNKNKK